MKKAFLTSEETELPFSEAYEANGFIYISGQVHLGTDGELAGGDMIEKTNLTLDNIVRVLTSAGLTKDDIVKVEIYLPNLERDGDAVREAYAAFWKHPMPARAMIGVKDLPLGADIEMVATAVRPD